MNSNDKCVNTDLRHALAHAMGRMTTDAALREGIAAAGREEVVARFSIHAMVDAYCRHYDELLSGGK